MAKDITVLSVVRNDNNSGLFDLMVESAMKFTHANLKFIICDNGNNNLRKYVGKDNFIVVDNTKSNTSGSLQHGESLNKIFELVETDNFAIIESDCVILCNNWHDIDYSKYKLAAALKADGSKPGRPIYHACFITGSTRLLRHNGSIDFRPGKDSNRSNRAYKPWEDVCWRLHDKVSVAGEIKQLQFIDTKTGNGKCFNSSFQSDEFWKDGVAIAGHFGRGSNIGGKAIRNGFDHPKKQLEDWKSVVKDVLSK